MLSFWFRVNQTRYLKHEKGSGENGVIGVFFRGLGIAVYLKAKLLLQTSHT